MIERIRYGGVSNPYNYSEFTCDTAADIADLPTNKDIGKYKNLDTCSIGSKATVISDRTMYILNGNNQWVLLKDYKATGGGSSILIDETLTESGQAADAKAVGDKIAEVKESAHTHSNMQALMEITDADITALHSTFPQKIYEIEQSLSDYATKEEVTQARVDANGTTYSTLKERLDSTDENVESVSTELKGDLDDLNDKIFYFKSQKDKIKLTALSTETAKCIYASEYTTLSGGANSTVCIYDNLIEGDTLFVSSTVMNGGYSWGFSFTDDRNKTIYHHVDDTLPSLTDKTDVEIIVPTGATKLYVSRLTSKGEPEVYKEVKFTTKIPKFVNDVLYGKKLLVFGDSMAYGHTIPDKVWVKLLADKYNMTLINKAQNGTTIVRKTTTIGDSEFLDTDSIYAKVMDNLNNPVDADYVVVFGGTNDIARNDQCTLGTIDDTSSQTFYGALNAICQRLIQTYPTGHICFITPYIRNAGLATTEISKQYVKAIHDVCEKWGGIPVFDNTVNGALDFSNSYQVNTLTMQDSYHLNEDGHKRAMHKYEVFLQSI